MKYIINDVGVKNTGCLKQFEIHILDPNNLTTKLSAWNGWSDLDKNTTKILFPGNGANDVLKSFGPEWFNEWHTQAIKASRFWWPNSGSSPVAVVESPDWLDDKTENVVIVDDVISSGATIQKVKQRHEVWLPRARWHAIAWVAQNSAVLHGFTSHYASVTVGTTGAKVPINSLSTLLTNSEVAESYALRNFPKPKVFLAALRALK